GHVRRGGAPAAGVDVRAHGGPAGSANATTDNLGAYTLNGLSNANYALSLSIGASVVANLRMVVAGATDAARHVPSTGSVEGTLVGFHDLASVSARNGLLRASVWGADGSFSMTDLVPGSYQLTASSEGGDDADATVTVEADKVAHVTLTARGLT